MQVVVFWVGVWLRAGQDVGEWRMDGEPHQRARLGGAEVRGALRGGVEKCGGEVGGTAKTTTAVREKRLREAGRVEVRQLWRERNFYRDVWLDVRSVKLRP
jgi:hypothetical protein